MTNPFESGHIKNYILAYVSVVVIMILFFIASTLFHDVEQLKKKEFKELEQKKDTQVKSSWTSDVKLMDKKY
jgi:hypothetical protein